MKKLELIRRIGASMISSTGLLFLVVITVSIMNKEGVIVWNYFKVLLEESSLIVIVSYPFLAIPLIIYFWGEQAKQAKKEKDDKKHKSRLLHQAWSFVVALFLIVYTKKYWMPIEWLHVFYIYSLYVALTAIIYLVLWVPKLKKRK